MTTVSKGLVTSFSSANIDLPAKVVQHGGVSRGGVIAPVHIQWMPTNRCNATCSFCSCADRDKGAEIDIDRSREAIETFAAFGTRAVTITGGGEPTLYYAFHSLVDVFCKNGIEVGIVTNGLNMVDWDHGTMSRARWIRVSISDEHKWFERDTFEANARVLPSSLRSVDVAFSYVVTDNARPDYMRRALDAVNKFGYTHIRFVLDISDPNESVDFDGIFAGMDTSKAIIQPRTSYEPGTSECLIALAKPVIGADGHVYPCCGVQYAKAGTARDMAEEFRMGELEDIADIWGHQWPYDGSRCDKCYYGAYNRTLAILKAANTTRHRNFI